MSLLMLICLLQPAVEDRRAEEVRPTAVVDVPVEAGTEQVTEPQTTIRLFLGFKPTRNTPLVIRGTWTRRDPFEVAVRVAPPCFYFSVAAYREMVEIEEKDEEVPTAGNRLNDLRSSACDAP